MSDKAVLTEKQIDAIGEIGNISMSSAATAMHDIISRKVIITTPDVTVMSVGELTNLYNARLSSLMYALPAVWRGKYTYHENRRCKADYLHPSGPGIQS